ncbi:hypothetical protein EXIGLDRAFT_754060 [Exidia glandulosa HHB12029]|uniref:Uncharacterized protein n=1 Tax=Exidia glandulosa HHB12029 TaxID=1314781 RepID=A0A165DAB9_EXIGL|nr:hypothetical protein EXIGLDRAFT_754060 [Exidia glandulosa HHB12029]
MNVPTPYGPQFNALDFEPQVPATPGPAPHRQLKRCPPRNTLPQPKFNIFEVQQSTSSQPHQFPSMAATANNLLPAFSFPDVGEDGRHDAQSPMRQTGTSASRTVDNVLTYTCNFTPTVNGSGPCGADFTQVQDLVVHIVDAHAADPGVRYDEKSIASYGVPRGSWCIALASQLERARSEDVWEGIEIVK